MQAMASLSNPNSDSRGEGAITAVLQVPTRFDHVALALAAKRSGTLWTRTDMTIYNSTVSMQASVQASSNSNGVR